MGTGRVVVAVATGLGTTNSGALPAELALLSDTRTDPSKFCSYQLKCISYTADNYKNRGISITLQNCFPAVHLICKLYKIVLYCQHLFI